MFCCFSVSAQQLGGTINGKVTDDKGSVVALGTVYLLKATDSSLVKLALINSNGFFEFTNLKEGSYRLSVSVMGYGRPVIPVILLDRNASEGVGNIVVRKGVRLKELDIKAQTNYVDIKPGKIVINVSKSLMAAGNTALDILNTAPGVQINDNGYPLLKGKEATVTINGKQVYLSADALTDLLRNTPSNTIAQIELVSSPNASYSAEGSGGVINIKTLRNKSDGVSGSVNANYGITDINQQYGTRSKWGSGFSLDYNNKKLSLFGGFAHTDNIYQRLSMTDRAVYTPSLKQINTNYLNDLNDRGNNFRLGIDYTISPKQVLGVLVNGVYSNYDYTKNTTTITNVNGSPDSMFISNSLTTRRLVNYTVNLNYRTDLGKLGQLSADADYAVFDRKPNETIYTDAYVLHPVIKLLKMSPPSYIQNTFPTLYHIYTFSLNDEIKSGKKSTLLVSAKLSYVTNDNTVDFGYITNGVYNPDPAFTSLYNYNEQINALGIVYNAALNKKTNIEIGLRGEQTINHGQAASITMTQPGTTNNYVDLFPSFLLTSNLADDDQLSFSYGRRIRRPLYTDLNPSLNYQDQYNYFLGNTALRPQYTNTMELTNVFKQKFSATLSASLNSDYIFTTFLPGNIIAQKVNFGTDDGYGLQLNQALDLTRWWNTNINLIADYERYSNSLNGASATLVSTQYIVFSIHQQFSFLKQYKAELFTQYESPKYEAFYHYDQRYKFNAGLSKSILNKRASIQLLVLDIFNSYYNNYHTNYQGLNYTAHAQNSFRTYQINVSYTFSSKGAKAERQHKLGSSEEQSRAGG